MRQCSYTVLPTLALVVALLACKKGKENENASAAASAAASGNPQAMVEGANKAAASAAARHGTTLSKKGCDLLTADDVSTTFGVPAAALRQTKVVGCIYSWSQGDETLQARVGMIMSHQSEQAATTWFANATKNKSAKEVEKTLDDSVKQVKKKAKDGELGKKVSPGAVDVLAKGLTGAVDPRGTRYEDVAGIGDAARVQLDNGTLWVRAGNVTFNVSGYKGKRQPHVAPSGNLKQIAQKAHEAQRAFLAETYQERKAASQKVAKLVLGKLDKL